MTPLGSGQVAADKDEFVTFNVISVPNQLLLIGLTKQSALKIVPIRSGDVYPYSPNPSISTTSKILNLKEEPRRLLVNAQSRNYLKTINTSHEDGVTAVQFAVYFPPSDDSNPTWVVYELTVPSTNPAAAEVSLMATKGIELSDSHLPSNPFESSTSYQYLVDYDIIPVPRSIDEASSTDQYLLVSLWNKQRLPQVYYAMFSPSEKQVSIPDDLIGSYSGLITRAFRSAPSRWFATQTCGHPVFSPPEFMKSADDRIDSIIAYIFSPFNSRNISFTPAMIRPSLESFLHEYPALRQHPEAAPIFNRLQRPRGNIEEEKDTVLLTMELAVAILQPDIDQDQASDCELNYWLQYLEILSQIYVEFLYPQRLVFADNRILAITKGISVEPRTFTPIEQVSRYLSITPDGARSQEFKMLYTSLFLDPASRFISKTEGFLALQAVQHLVAPELRTKFAVALVSHLSTVENPARQTSIDSDLVFWWDSILSQFVEVKKIPSLPLADLAKWCLNSVLNADIPSSNEALPRPYDVVSMKNQFGDFVTALKELAISFVLAATLIYAKAHVRNTRSRDSKKRELFLEVDGWLNVLQTALFLEGCLKEDVNVKEDDLAVDFLGLDLNGNVAPKATNFLSHLVSTCFLAVPQGSIDVLEMKKVQLLLKETASLTDEGRERLARIALEQKNWLLLEHFLEFMNVSAYHSYLSARVALQRGDIQTCINQFAKYSSVYLTNQTTDLGSEEQYFDHVCGLYEESNVSSGVIHFGEIALKKGYKGRIPKLVFNEYLKSKMFDQAYSLIAADPEMYVSIFYSMC